MKIEDLSEGLMVSDVLTPAQFYASVGGARDAAIRPVKLLMLAVLEDGLRCYQSCRGSRTGVQRQLFAETEVWLWDRKADGPFAFETICDTLGIDAGCLRSALLKSQLKELNGEPVRRLARRSPVTHARELSAASVRGRRKPVTTGGDRVPAVSEWATDNTFQKGARRGETAATKPQQRDTPASSSG